MSLDELLEVSSDANVGVPDGFMERIGAAVGDMDMVEALTEDEVSHEKRRRFIPYISVAAAVALIAGIGFSFIENEPKDTFDDPQLAYAELEKAFGKISDGVARGVAMAEDSGKLIEKTSKVFE